MRSLPLPHSHRRASPPTLGASRSARALDRSSFPDGTSAAAGRDFPLVVDLETPITARTVLLSLFAAIVCGTMMGVALAEAVRVTL